MRVATADPNHWDGCPGAPARDSDATASYRDGQVSYPVATAAYQVATVARRRDSDAVVDSDGPAGSLAASVSAAMGDAPAAWAAAAGDAPADVAAAAGGESSNRAAHTRVGRHSSGPNNRRC